jgi:polyhydroxyalkanoate synthesis regulator phasin
MNDLIKRGLLIGLGATVIGKEKADKFFNDLSKSGGVAGGEIKSFLDSLSDKGKTKQEQWQNDLRKDMTDAIKDLGFVTADEYNQLKEKVNELEAKVKAAEDGKPDTTATGE